MCGIAGILRFDQEQVEPQRLEEMLVNLRHRGPDGEGVTAMGECGFVHTRLSIIDLLGGDQPMRVPATSGSPGLPGVPGTAVAGQQGELTLVFNGEIYNHRSVRKKLERLGHRFVSDHCDTEVLLHGYRQWGTQLPKLLHGMFSFAIWDAGQRELFLCRDRAGKKPLYLCRRGDREMVFGSLISTVLAGLPAGERPAIDRQAMLHFLRFGYTGQRSLLQGIEELPAAHWMVVDSQGQTKTEPYWQPPPVSRTSTSLGAVDATRELLEEAVAKRLEADVPLGCFLSGGIDSSIIAALAQRELKRRGDEPLRTFCVRMPHEDFDESRHAALVARHIGAHHTELMAQASAQTFDDLYRLVAVTGEPMADSSLLPTFWLSQATRRFVKVALSGDGGDELFGGYDRYRAMRLLQKHHWWIRHLPAGLLPERGGRSMSTRLRRLIDAARGDGPPEQYFQMIHLFTDGQIGELGLWPDGSDGPVGPPIDPQRDWRLEIDAVHAAMRWDLCNYLPFDLLRKMDRASMAVALEVRSPMLDTQVCDLAGHLPPAVLMPHNKPKGLLRQLAAQLLPESIATRPKRGFAVPMGQWFRGPLREGLTARLLDGPLDSLGIARQPVERMLAEHQQGRGQHTHRLFALLTLSLWSQWLTERSAPAWAESQAAVVGAR